LNTLQLQCLILNTKTNKHVRGTAIMHGHTEWPSRSATWPRYIHRLL